MRKKFNAVNISTDMAKEEFWELWLYIAGQTPKSVLALENITRYSKEHLLDKHSIEVVDLLKTPHLAEQDEIFAIPTLIKKTPKPLKRIIGDLSDKEKVLAGLNMH